MVALHRAPPPPSVGPLGLQVMVILQKASPPPLWARWWVPVRAKASSRTPVGAPPVGPLVLQVLVILQKASPPPPPVGPPVGPLMVPFGAKASRVAPRSASGQGGGVAACRPEPCIILYHVVSMLGPSDEAQLVPVQALGRLAGEEPKGPQADARPGHLAEPQLGSHRAPPKILWVLSCFCCPQLNHPEKGNFWMDVDGKAKSNSHHEMKPWN